MVELPKQTRENNFLLQRTPMIPTMVVTFRSGMGHWSLISIKKGVQKNTTDSYQGYWDKTGSKEKISSDLFLHNTVLWIDKSCYVQCKGIGTHSAIHWVEQQSFLELHMWIMKEDIWSVWVWKYFPASQKLNFPMSPAMSTSSVFVFDANFRIMKLHPYFYPLRYRPLPMKSFC